MVKSFLEKRSRLMSFFNQTVESIDDDSNWNKKLPSLSLLSLPRLQVTGPLHEVISGPRSALKSPRLIAGLTSQGERRGDRQRRSAADDHVPDRVPGPLGVLYLDVLGFPGEQPLVEQAQGGLRLSLPEDGLDEGWHDFFCVYFFLLLLDSLRLSGVFFFFSKFERESVQRPLLLLSFFPSFFSFFQTTTSIKLFSFFTSFAGLVFVVELFPCKRTALLWPRCGNGDLEKA